MDHEPPDVSIARIKHGDSSWEGLEKRIELDRETAEELLKYLSHQYVNYKYTRIHELIKRLNKFTEKK